MMLYLFLLISCFSFLLLSKSFMKTTNILFFKRNRISKLFFPLNKTSSTIDTSSKQGICLLDLPDLALDNIVKKLSPAELCGISSVCRYMREICTSDHLWEKHMNMKWGGVIGHSAYKEWELHIASKEIEKRRRLLPVNSVMFFYLALETGKFWFPAQVFNREVQNGHFGFMLSCYDAKLSYDLTTNSFVARYPCHGTHMTESDVEWNRIRAQNVVIPANVLHISDRLDELKPNDHIEIQWRRNKEFPYGWWYGVVGHLESCRGNEVDCECRISDTVMLELKQYGIGSTWRKMTIGRNEYREVGNKADGFYGGIRKIDNEEEIAKWEHLCPNSILE